MPYGLQQHNGRISTVLPFPFDPCLDESISAGRHCIVCNRADYSDPELTSYHPTHIRFREQLESELDSNKYPVDALRPSP